MINDLLFVYGSLLNADNEFAAYLSKNSTRYDTGKLNGRLYDIGEYPGAIIGREGNYPIAGTIYQLNNAQAALSVLDDYEGFGAGQQQPNLFIRGLLPVGTPNGSINCWVYLYNLPVDGLAQIPSGDYINSKPL